MIRCPAREPDAPTLLAGSYCPGRMRVECAAAGFRGAWSTSRPAVRSISHSRIIGSPCKAVGSSPRIRSNSTHPRLSGSKAAGAVVRPLQRHVRLDVGGGERLEFHRERNDVDLDAPVRGVQHHEAGAEFEPSPTGHLELGGVGGMVAGLAEHPVVDQCDLIGSDHQSGSDSFRHCTGLLLRQAADERLGCFSLVGGFVDVGRHDPKRNRKPLEERPAR